MKLIERIKSKTSRRNRIKGQVSTVIGVTCAVILSLGLVVNPIGLVALTVGSVLFGGDAVQKALKIGEDLEEK